MQRIENELFERTPIPVAYFKLSLPLVCSMGLSLVYNMVDTYFIARTGNTALVAGVSLSAPVFSFLIAVGDILGLGGTSFISRLYGGGKDEAGKRVSVVCFYGALLLGVVITVLLLVLRTPVLHLLGAKEDTIRYASQYYTWLILGAPFIILTFTPTNQLRAEGLTTEAMLGSVSGTVLNIILDPILISALGWGAAGAAIATVLGNICTDAYYIWVLRNKSRWLSMDIRLFRASGEELAEILKIGIPASVTNLMQSVCTTVTNRFLLPYGTTCVAAMGIALKVNLISGLILVALAFGPQPMIGYNYGAGNTRRLKKAIRFSYCFECLMGVGFTVVLSLAAPLLIRVFMQNPEIVEPGTLMLRMQLAGMLGAAVCLVTTVLFQATGKALGALCLSLSRQGVIFVAVISALSRLFGYRGVICAQAVSDFTTAALALVLLYRLLWREFPGND